MDDIATHARKLVLPYVPSPKAQQVIASAKQVAKLVLHDQALLPLHRSKILSLVQWFISEADGKHTTRFRSQRVVELATNEPTSREKVNHDHVFTRSELVQRIVAEPHRVEELLDTVVGCVVTKSEHDSMSSTASGWARYSQAGIVVLDMAHSPPVVYRAG